MNSSTNKAINEYSTKRFNDVSFYGEWEIVKNKTSDKIIPQKRHRRSSTPSKLLQFNKKHNLKVYKGKKKQIPQNLEISCNTSHELSHFIVKTELPSRQLDDHVMINDSLSSIIDNNHHAPAEESKIRRQNKIDAANCSWSIKKPPKQQSLGPEMIYRKNRSRTRESVQQQKRSRSLTDRRRFSENYCCKLKSRSQSLHIDRLNLNYCRKLRSQSQSSTTNINDSTNDTTYNHHNYNESSVSSVDNLHDYPMPDQKPIVKVSREVKQLEKMCKESKVLTKYLNDSLNDTKLRQKKVVPPPLSSAAKSTKVKVAVDDSWIIEKSPKQRSKSVGFEMIFCRNRSRTRIENEPVQQQNRSRSLTDCRRIDENYCRKLRSRSQSSQTNENYYMNDTANNGSVCSDNKTKNTIERKKKTKKSSDNHLTKVGRDKFCFNCHQDQTTIPCSTCKRSYHIKCLRSKCEPKNINNPFWKCPECTIIADAEMLRKRTTNSELNQLRTMLLFALKRLAKISGVKQTSGISTAISCTVPMSFNILEGNICSKLYKTTEEFLADVKWILHNCYTSPNRSTKLITASKELIKACKQEMYEIDTCIECYNNANVHIRNWFVKVCSKPHILLWAKLKGFPYWPAKMMGISATSLIDVRFFGQHDRAWLPARDCYLFSRDDPNVTTSKAKRNSILSCLKEVDIYIENIRKKYGSFEYAEFKQTFNPHMSYDDHLQSMIPQYSPYITDNDINDDDMTNQLNLNSSDLTYKIIKSPNNHLSIIKKTNPIESGNEINQHKSTKHQHHHHHHHRTKSPTSDKDSPTNTIYEILPTSSGNATKVVLKRKSSHSENVVERKIQRKSIDESSTVNQSTKRKLETIKIAPTSVSTVLSSLRASKRVKKRLSANLDNDNPIVSSTVISPLQNEKIRRISKGETTNKKLTKKTDSTKDTTKKSLANYMVLDSSIPIVNSTITSDIDTTTTPDLDHHTDDNASGSDIPSSTTKQLSVPPPPQPVPFSQSRDSQPPPPRLASEEEGDENLLIPLTRIKTESNYDEDECLPTKTTTATTANEQNMLLEIKSENCFINDDSDVSIKIEEPEFVEMSNVEATIPTPYQRPTRKRNNIATTTKPIRKINPKQNGNRFGTMTKSTNLPAPPNRLNGNTLNGMVYIPLDNNPNSSIFGNNLNIYDTVNSLPTPLVSRCKSTTTLATRIPINLQSASSAIIVTSSNHATSSTITSPTTTTNNVIIQSTEPTILNTSTTTTNTADDQPIVTSKQSEPIAETKSQLIQDYVKKVGSLFTAMLMKNIDDITNIEQIDQLKTRILELEIQEEQYHFNKTFTELKLAADKCKINIKQKYDREKERLLEELKKKLEAENQQKYNEIKSKQWCCMCDKEAFYYCCFNVSYCSNLCQKNHWAIHAEFCRNGDDLTSNAKIIQSTTNKTDQQQTLLTTPIIATSNIPNHSIVLTESEFNDLVANRLAAKSPANENRSFASATLVPISSNPTTTLIAPYHDNTLTNGGSLLSKNQTNGTKFVSSKPSTTNNRVPPLCILSAKNSARVSTPSSSFAKPASVVQIPTPNLVSLANGTRLTLPRTCTVKMIQRNGIANNVSAPGLAVLSTTPSLVSASKAVVLTRKPNTMKKNAQTSSTIALNCLNQIQQKPSFTIFNQQGGHLIFTPIPSSNSSTSTSIQSTLPHVNRQHHPPLTKIHVNGAVGGLQQKQ